MLSQNLSQLTEELASGRVADVNEHLGGDISHLLDINRDLTRLDGFDTAIVEAGGIADAMQASLSLVQSTGEDLAAALIKISTGNLNASGTAVTEQAYLGLDTVISALNTTVAGRSLYGGVATDRAPMGTAQTLLDALEAQIAPSASASEIRAAAEAWFDNPDGFHAIVYTGADQSRNPVQIGAREQVNLSLRADDDIFRNAMLDLSMVAFAGRDDLALSYDVRASLRHDAMGSLLAGTDALTGLRAELGYAQTRIEDSAARNAAARASLDMARATMIEADPYDTALQLEEVQFQLESLYTVTARNSRLSLLSYLE